MPKPFPVPKPFFNGLPQSGLGSTSQESGKPDRTKVASNFWAGDRIRVVATGEEGFYWGYDQGYRLHRVHLDTAEPYTVQWFYDSEIEAVGGGE